MRKVTSEIVRAFMAGDSLTVGNTQTDGQAIWLHGNKIAEWRGTGMWITTAGWQTNTTKERLNGLPGVKVDTKNFDLFLNDKAWNGAWVKVSDWSNLK